MPDSPQPTCFGYNGEDTDYTTGLQYLRARYYDLTSSRFIQKDIYRGEISNTHTINRYAYVGNNPIMHIDPSGHRRVDTDYANSNVKYQAPKAVTVKPPGMPTSTWNKIPSGQKTIISNAVKASKSNRGNSGGSSGGSSNNTDNSYSSFSQNDHAKDLDGDGTITADEVVAGMFGGQLCLETDFSWDDDEFFGNNWFLDQEKLKIATEKLAEEIEGKAIWEIDGSAQIQTLQAILRVQDTNVSGMIDDQTISNIENRLMASGRDNFDAIHLNGDDIIAIYNSINQERKGYEKWYINGGDEVLAGATVLASYVAIRSVANSSKSNNITSSTEPKGVCFIVGTVIATYFGQKAIENIKAGDKVYSENPETGEKGFKQVVRTFVKEANEIVRLVIDGEEIITTPEHPFFIKNQGWTSAADLQAGFEVKLLSGRIAIIEAVEVQQLDEPIKVYNFEVEGFHTYYVGQYSALVHNQCKKYYTSEDTLNNHIIKRHGPNSTATNKSKFVKGLDIKSHIDDVLTDSSSSTMQNTNGRAGTIFEKTYNYTVGNNTRGKPLNTIKVVVDDSGNVITAFPKK